jgi:hypothetical protein
MPQLLARTFHCSVRPVAASAYREKALPVAIATGDLPGGTGMTTDPLAEVGSAAVPVSTGTRSDQGSL